MFADQAGTITKTNLEGKSDERRQKRRTERIRQDDLARIVQLLKYSKRGGGPLRRTSQGGCGGPADCLVEISG